MSDLSRRTQGTSLSPDDYFEDFYPRFWSIDGGDFWKLERIQSFQEQGSESWDAYVRGDRAEALRLIEARRGSLADYYGRIADSGFTTYRVRVVEDEITPYLQWQLHSLRQRHELGERIRVVSGSDIASLEQNGTLPEIVTVGTNCFYEVLYDEDGVITGAVRSDDPDELTRWRILIEDLYATGEDIDKFVDRRIDSPQPSSQHQ